MSDIRENSITDILIKMADNIKQNQDDIMRICREIDGSDETEGAIDGLATKVVKLIGKLYNGQLDAVDGIVSFNNEGDIAWPGGKKEVENPTNPGEQVTIYQKTLGFEYGGTGSQSAHSDNNKLYDPEFKPDSSKTPEEQAAEIKQNINCDSLLKSFKVVYTKGMDKTKGYTMWRKNPNSSSATKFQYITSDDAIPAGKTYSFYFLLPKELVNEYLPIGIVGYQVNASYTRLSIQACRLLDATFAITAHNGRYAERCGYMSIYNPTSSPIKLKEIHLRYLLVRRDSGFIDITPDTNEDVNNIGNDSADIEI